MWNHFGCWRRMRVKKEVTWVPKGFWEWENTRYFVARSYFGEKKTRKELVKDHLEIAFLLIFHTICKWLITLLKKTLKSIFFFFALTPLWFWFWDVYNVTASIKVLRQKPLRPWPFKWKSREEPQTVHSPWDAPAWLQTGHLASEVCSP